MRLVLAVSVPAAILVQAMLPAIASAQVAHDDFQPALDARGFFTQNASATLDDRDVSFGLGSLDWGRNLDPSVHDMVTATLVGAAGLHVAGVPLEFGASLPLGIESGAQSQQQVGDLGLHLKARLAHVGAFGLGAIGSVYVPSGDWQATGVIDARAGRFRIAFNGGVRKQSMMEMSSTELVAGAGAAWALAPEKLELVTEVFGAKSTGIQALGGVKLYLAKNSYLSLGAGRGIDTGDFRAMIAIVFEPKPAQRLTGHIDDEVAEVTPPKQPADTWSDRDNDGIPDKDDKCPDDPENYNGYQDDDGCPDEEPRDLVVDTGSTLVTLEGIEFEFDKAVIAPVSFKVLDAVAKALADNTGIHLVEVQGHTDEQGSAEYNKDLSQRRAGAVVAYLVEHGVAPERLTPHGYGESQPLDPAHTQAAYAKNRRVVFQIKDRQ